MNNTERIKQMEAKLQQCDRKIRTLSTQMRLMEKGIWLPHNVQKGRFTTRRLQNEYPNMLVFPRN